MTPTQRSPIDTYFLLLAGIADTVGLLTFVGVDPAATTRLAVVGTLAAIGTAVSLVSLVSAARIFFSVKGRFYPSRYHVRRLSMAGVAFLLSVAFCVLVLGRVQQNDDDQRQPLPSPSSVAPSTGG